MCQGHSDTRERWTCNFTTFSDKERIMRGEYPYCEFMFRADGDKVQLRLREYIRSRGFGPWVSVTTSEKAAYRLADILNFLERHLPPYSESRPWGIMRADVFPLTTTMPCFVSVGFANTSISRTGVASRLSLRRQTRI